MHPFPYGPILGEFELLVLLALLRLGNGAFGAAIHREIAGRTARDITPGAVYVTLDRLEAKKMVCSYIGAPTAQRGGHARRQVRDAHRAVVQEHRRGIRRGGPAERAVSGEVEEMEILLFDRSPQRVAQGRHAPDLGAQRFQHPQQGQFFFQPRQRAGVAEPDHGSARGGGGSRYRGMHDHIADRLVCPRDESSRRG